MNRIFTGIFCLLMMASAAAAPPTVPSSNFLYSNIEGSRITFRFTSGNGSSRIVVMRMSNPVSGLPVNGNEYTASTVFGTAGTSFTVANEYVVYKGNGNSFTVTGLLPNTTYHLAVFELNGTGASTEYLAVPLTGSRSTSITPVTQASNLNFTQVGGSTLRLNFTAGSGEGRIVIARKGAPVNATPADLESYSGNTDFGSGSILNGDNYVVYAGNSNYAVINMLEPDKTYHFAVFERNGNSYPVYKTPGVTASRTTAAGPTTPTASVVFSSIEGDRISVSVSKGNGSRRLIIARKGGPVTSLPENGNSYAASAAFGSGSQLATGEFVVFNNTSTSVIVTGLEPDAVYHFRSIEYDQDSEGNTWYLNTPRDNSSSTATTPNAPSDVSIINVTGNSLTLRYNAGTGNYRFVIAREGAAVSAQPQNLVKYNGNTSFGSGPDMGNGNFIITGGSNGSSASITNLRPGYTYHFAVYEYTGVNYPVYSTSSNNISITMPAQPLTPASNFSSNTIQGNSFRAAWTNGDGSRRIVIARKNEAVTAQPVDGVNYTASSTFGNGTPIEPGQFVVYDGTNATASLENLEIGTTYHLAVFEYNQLASVPDYLTSSLLRGSASTLSAPTQQVSSITSTNIQANSATFTYTPGNSEYQLFVMKQGTAVDAEPVNLANYSTNSIFGNALLSNGNYLVHKGTVGSAFTITGLQPGTTYHLAAFGLNGSSAPVYARPGYGINFTTTGVAPTPSPTIAPGNAVFPNPEGNSIRINWTNGNGSERLVVARIGGSVTFSPADGSSYIADAAWGQGQSLGDNQFVIYRGNQSSTTLTGLTPASTVHFAVFEFNGNGASSNYLTDTYLEATGNTVSSPTTIASGIQQVINETSVQLQWQKGNGQGRMVIVRESNAVSNAPADLTSYPANPVFGSGSQTGLGEYVVYAGTGQQVTVTGLTNNKVYHYRIIEFNGSAAPVYATSYLDGQFSVGTPLPVTWLYFKADKSSNGILIKWATAMEENNERFIVERSIGNAAFEAIDSINGAGNSNQQNHYQYLDAAPTAQSLRYRIKQVDIDGRFTYSAVVQVLNHSTAKAIQLYPNPAKEQFIITGWQASARATAVIIDMNGKTVARINVQQGQPVNISNLVPGHYLVRLLSGGEEYVLKMMKDR